MTTTVKKVALLVPVLAIALAGCSVLTTVKVNETVRDVATIRQAMKNFAENDRICCGEGTADLTQWFQLRGFTSGAIRDEAIQNGQSTTLSAVNPWGGDYTFVVDPLLPYQFELRITGVDDAGLDSLMDVLADGAEGRPTVAMDQITVVYPI